MIKGIIFDFDGTLVNTLPDLTSSLNRALLEFGFNNIYTQEEVKLLIGSGIRNLCARAIKETDLTNPLIDQIYARFKEIYLVHQLDESIPYPNVIDTLNELKRMGIKLAILSNKQDENVHIITDALFEKDLFSFVLGYKEPFKLKPDPTSVEYILDSLSLKKEEVLYVGDSDVDIETAKNAQIKVIALTYGYREKKILLRHNPDYILDEFQNIIGIVKKS